MDKERLQQLRRVVENAPEERLEMKRFCTGKSCGTAYCAAGWAAIDPWFQSNTNILDIFDLKIIGTGVYVEEKDDVVSFDMLAEMFKLSDRDATNLFGGNLGYHSPSVPKSDVLRNIDLLLAGEPAVSYRR